MVKGKKDSGKESSEFDINKALNEDYEKDRKGRLKPLAEKVKSGYGKVTRGIPFFTPFFSWLGKWLFKFSKFGIVLIFLAFFIIFLIAGFNYLVVQEQGVVLAKHAEVAAKEKGGFLAGTFFENIYDLAFNPSENLYTAYSFESDIERKNKGDKDLGLRITQLDPVSQRYFVGQPIFLKGTIKAKPFEKEIHVKVDCDLEDYDGEVKISSSAPDSGEEGKFKIYKDFSQTFTVTCNFPEGIKISETELFSSKEVPIVSKEAEMKASYDFVTQASHNTYFLNKEEHDKLLSRGIDPFENFKVNDPQLRSDRTVKSKASPGPINLGIGTYSSQPFSRGKPYFFGVSLSNNPLYKGHLKKLKQLKVMLPPYLVVANEEGFGEGGTCDFYFSGNLNENGFKIYYLKEEKLREANIDCESKSIKEKLISYEECMNRYKSSFEYLCQFKVKEPIQEEVLRLDFIRAEADYIYETSKKTIVDIRRSPASEDLVA